MRDENVIHIEDKMYESRMNIQSLKQKLINIYKTTKFCGICLSNDKKLWATNTEFDLAVSEQIQTKLLKDIIDYILNDMCDHILASVYICHSCTEKSIQSYLFIYNAKKFTEIIYKCVNELYSKTVEVQQQFKQSVSEYENSNVLIVLEPYSEIWQNTDINKETPKPIDNEDTNAIISNESTKDFEPKNYNNYEIFDHIDISHKQEKVVERIQPLFSTQTVDIELQAKCIEKEQMIVENSNLNNAENLKIDFIDSQIIQVDKNDIAITFLDKEYIVHTTDYLSNSEDREDNKHSPGSRKRKKMAISYQTYKCKACREILPSYKAWKEHVKICRTPKDKSNKNLFHCKICSETFVSQRTLNTHYKMHSKVRCKVCQFIVPQEDMTEHMKINHEDYIHPCKLCKFFTFNADILKVHMKKNHSGSKCALCFKKVSEIDLKLHKCRFNCLECTDNICIHYKYLLSYRDQVLNNVTKIKCVDCDYICPRREALLGHANREHLNHHPFTCAHCSQQFYSRTTLRHHLNQFHKEKHICEFCDQEFSTTLTLNNHKETCQNIERHHKCHECTSSFVALGELANHVKLRHEKESLNCNLCKRQFLTNTKLREHIFRVHSGLQMKRKRSILNCPICEVKYKTKKQLYEHIKDHGPESRFPCKDCETDFDSLKKLHAHVRIHYDDVIQCIECKKVLTATFFPHHMVYCKPGRDEKEIFTCETCGKTYYSEIQLKLHHKTHMEKTPCPICEKPTKPVYMKNHIKYMHSKQKKIKKIPKPKTKYYIKCNWCEHIVSRYGELETHVNRFHLKIKPYQCDYCSKSFFGKERLRDHLITHTTTRMCYCSVCNKKLENKACLKLHMRRHTGDTPYACEICGERFRTSSIMNTHKVKKHSEKTIACPLCESMFYLTREMRSHFKKVHWKQKGKKFDPRDVKELNPKFYYLFEDGRVPKVEGEDLYISSKFNEKFS